MLASLNSRWKSSPLMPGSLTSSTRQLGASRSWLCTNSCADPNPSTRNPTDSTSRLMARRTDGSSSTTKTTDASSVIKTPFSQTPEDETQYCIEERKENRHCNGSSTIGQPPPDERVARLHQRTIDLMQSGVLSWLRKAWEGDCQTL